MNNEKNTMANAIPAAGVLRNVPGFDPMEYAQEATDKAGQKVLKLDLKHKKTWFRLACPNGGVVLNALRVTDTMAIFEARLFADRADRNPLASFTATKTADKSAAGQYIRSAQDEALSEALDNAGFDIRLYDLMKSTVSGPKSIDAAPESKTEPAPAAQDNVSHADEETARIAPGTSPQAKKDVQDEEKAPETVAANNGRPAPVAPQPHSTPTPDKDSAPPSVVDIATRLPVNTEKQNSGAQEQSKPEFQRVTEITAQPAAAKEEPQEGDPSEAETAAPVIYTADMTVEEICQRMTLEQAKAHTVPQGTCKGWTLGQVAKDRFASLRWFTTVCPFADNVLRAAAKLVLQHMSRLRTRRRPGKEMAEYSNPKRIVWYDGIPCPVCGAERTNSWEKRICRALGYQAIVCEKCVAKEYGLTVEKLRETMRGHFGLIPCPGI